MDLFNTDTDWEDLDTLTLEKMAAIANTAKDSLINGLITLRNLNSQEASNLLAMDNIVEDISMLTLAWDEILVQINRQLAVRQELEENNTAVKPTTVFH